MGSVRPRSHWKAKREAKREAQLAGNIISPPKRILLTFFDSAAGPI